MEFGITITVLSLSIAVRFALVLKEDKITCTKSSLTLVKLV